jgi:vanillate O-demethylase ferredoxin subunit
MQVHKLVGIYSGAILLLLVLTGLPLSFDWYRHGLYTLTGSALPEKFPKSKLPAAGEPGRLSMQAAWDQAQAVVPNWSEVLIHYPAKPAAPVDMYLIERDAPHANARTMLFLDAYSGAVLRHTPYAQSSAGHKLYFWTISFHTGQVGGLPGQLLLLAAALGVPVLAYTGIASWLRRRSAGASRKQAVSAAAS